MVVSLLKLLTNGIQDERIYDKGGNIFFPFLKTWTRTARFTTRWERIDFADPVEFGSSGHAYLPTKGHLCTRLFLMVTMPDIFKSQDDAIKSLGIAGSDFVGPRFGWTNSLGHALIQSASITIGGLAIDNLDSLLLEIMDEYNTPLEKVTVVNRLIQRVDNGFTQTTFGNTTTPVTVAIPLPFWFCRGDPRCALPVDAIANDDIVVSVKFRELNGLYYTDSRNVISEPSGMDGSALWNITGSVLYKKDGSGSVIPGLATTHSGGKVSVIPGITMPNTFKIGEHYLLAEYVYLDSVAASKFRNSDLQMPIVQHHASPVRESHGLPTMTMSITAPNPTKDIYWLARRREAHLYNAHFLATRDLKGASDASGTIWWPDASGLSAISPAFLRPAFALSDSEPLRAVSLTYEGSLVRFRTEAPAMCRSILPSLEQKKGPWVNRYYYNYSFGLHNKTIPLSRPLGEANLGKMSYINLNMDFQQHRGSFNPNDIPSYTVNAYTETYNVLRVYGGRAGMLFSY